MSEACNFLTRFLCFCLYRCDIQGMYLKNGYLFSITLDAWERERANKVILEIRIILLWIFILFVKFPLNWRGETTLLFLNKMKMGTKTHMYFYINFLKIKYFGVPWTKVHCQFLKIRQGILQSTTVKFSFLHMYVFSFICFCFCFTGLSVCPSM